MPADVIQSDTLFKDRLTYFLSVLVYGNIIWIEVRLVSDCKVDSQQSRPTVAFTVPSKEENFVRDGLGAR